MKEINGVRAEALWRAVVYVAVAQLHLVSNVLVNQPLREIDMKRKPAGHWGTVPGAAWALAHVGLVASRHAAKVIPLLGAGHTGVAQVALAWLTEDLQKLRPQYSLNEAGLQELVRAFPELDGLGAEVHPSLPAGDFLGGCIGGGLAFACGAAIDSPDCAILPIIGDGECETPATAAAWLAKRELQTGNVLPIVHLNGFRMGNRSVLGTMSDDEVADYFRGHGWQAQIFRIERADIQEHADFHQLLTRALDRSLRGHPTVLVMRCLKGWSGPTRIENRTISGTAYLHKTPITSPNDPCQLSMLQDWLLSYQPQEMFDGSGHPAGRLTDALAHVRVDRLNSDNAHPDKKDTVSPIVVQKSFAQAVTGAVYRQAASGDFRLFSPDELGSNRLEEFTSHGWVHEILAEEVALYWLAGWTSSGRRGLLISYESFASLFATPLIAQLKQRRLNRSSLPSLNLLLTSYGWHNVYTHGDPSLATTMLGVADPVLRVWTPADPTRLARVLDHALQSDGLLNLIVAGKHSDTRYPIATIPEEDRRGLAIWPHLSDVGEPDLTIICVGDLAASLVGDTVAQIRQAVRASVRVVNIADLTVLGRPAVWPHGLTISERASYFGTRAAILIVTIGHPSAIWGLLEGSFECPVAVLGWREPTGPASQAALASFAGFDAPGLVQAAKALLNQVAAR